MNDLLKLLLSRKADSPLFDCGKCVFYLAKKPFANAPCGSSKHPLAIKQIREMALTRGYKKKYGAGDAYGFISAHLPYGILRNRTGQALLYNRHYKALAETPAPGADWIISSVAPDLDFIGRAQFLYPGQAPVNETELRQYLSNLEAALRPPPSAAIINFPARRLPTIGGPL